MSKVLLAVGILVFFLSYPIPLIMMQSPDFQMLDTSGYETSTSALSIGNLLGLYFSAMYLSFTNVGIFTFFVIILQILGGLSVYLLIRG